MKTTTYNGKSLSEIASAMLHIMSDFQSNWEMGEAMGAPMDELGNIFVATYDKQIEAILAEAGLTATQFIKELETRIPGKQIHDWGFYSLLGNLLSQEEYERHQTTMPRIVKKFTVINIVTVDVEIIFYPVSGLYIWRIFSADGSLLKQAEHSYSSDVNAEIYAGQYITTEILGVTCWH